MIKYDGAGVNDREKSVVFQEKQRTIEIMDGNTYIT